MRFNLVLLIALLASIPAFAVKDSTLVLRTPSGNLYGTLHFGDPYSGKAGSPVVLIIPGSGPTDRNGNNPYLKNDAYHALADSLGLHGIATLRYDKRGIGESKAATPDEATLRFDTYVQDVDGWIALLQQSGIFRGVFLLGHSEGSLIGARAAQQSAKPVNGYISVAGPAQPADSILLQQLEAGKMMPQTMVDSVRMYFRMLRHGDSLQGVPKAYYPILRPGVVPYMASWIQYDPRKEIAAVKVPVLILQGTHDIQVSTAQYDMLMAAAPGAEGQKIEGMNHILRDAPATRKENIETYQSLRCR